ncbi:hypothetical protein D3C87_1677350 [compost metagenome]
MRAGRGQQQDVAVGRGIRHVAGADRAARAGLVFNHHGGAQLGAQLRREHAADDVGGAARGKRHDQAHGLVGVGGLLRRRGAGGQRGAGQQRQGDGGFLECHLCLQAKVSRGCD